MKRLLRAVLPTRVVGAIENLRLWRQMRREFLLDFKRYSASCIPDDSRARALRGRQLETQITKDYHRVEKGLALAEPRRPFGAEVARRLDSLIPAASAMDRPPAYLSHAVSARRALERWNAGGEIDDAVSPVVVGPELPEIDAQAFFESRKSVRDFAPTPVPVSVLSEATRLAINSPSVCNRQSWNVRFFQDRQDVDRLLKFQNGNAGFAHAVPVAALITVNCESFAAAGERNQPWIEGGLFSMSLVWALQALGVNSCMLNMSVSNEVADGLRAEFSIGSNELVVMMIAVGYGREGHRVARSPRRDVAEVLLGGDAD